MKHDIRRIYDSLPRFCDVGGSSNDNNYISSCYENGGRDRALESFIAPHNCKCGGRNHVHFIFP